MKQAHQQFRFKIRRAIEDFFISHSFLHAEVPLLTDYRIPESHIAPFKTHKSDPYGQDHALELIPSPEVYLKPLLAGGWDSLFCFSRCFRNSEQNGAHHNPEFTMLEYYLKGGNYIDSLKLTEKLLESLPVELPLSCRPPFKRISVEEAFRSYAGFSLIEAAQNNRLLEAVRSIGLSPSADSTAEELFNLTMVARIEEALPKDQPVVLIDYPAFVSTTAADTEEPFWSQRWELYLNGIETANCYTERASRKEMESYLTEERKWVRHESEQERRDASARDDDYARQFDRFPACSGTAIGFDRLLMALSGASNIDEILLFPDKKPVLS